MKFGQELTNLEALDRLAVNKTADELEERLKKQEHAWETTISQLNVLLLLLVILTTKVKLVDARSQTVETVNKNTTLLQKLHSLSEEQLKLEESLDTSSHSMVSVGFLISC